MWPLALVIASLTLGLSGGEDFKEPSQGPRDVMAASRPEAFPKGLTLEPRPEKGGICGCLAPGTILGLKVGWLFSSGDTPWIHARATPECHTLG
ncbi:KLK13 isoform 3 [Pan troglodytes]|uniref:KLK13 isoform 2 n=3 Tax=Pan TaxID=9596 RepID=A0A6D2VXY8_PANTR|nr:KLK13 isoform 2 [Pan troglodytes]PNI91924.1 KLK13 isoform 3 [Pan troglodytes]